MDTVASLSTRYLKYHPAHWETAENGIINEASVEVYLNGSSWVSLMCTPVQLEELAVGFLYNEGIISSIDEVEVIRPCEDKCSVDVWLSCGVEEPKQWRRTSGCSGGITRADLQLPPKSIPIKERIDPVQVTDMMDQLLESQELYHAAGGVHCSILTDGHQAQAIAEDIGRHNTLDKLAGRILMERLPREGWIILTTGRVSSEMLQKSARLGAYLIVSRTSPTSLSIQMARMSGITLIGYARRQQFNVYSYPERLRGSPSLP